MKHELLTELIHPKSRLPFVVDSYETENHDILEGVLRSEHEWFPIVEGVPRMLLGRLQQDWSAFANKHALAGAGSQHPVDVSAQLEQSKTTATFSDKWERFQSYGHSPEHQAFLNSWYAQKLGLQDNDDLRSFYASKQRILEIGPGSGFNTKFMASNTKGQVIAVDISEGAVTTYRNTRDLDNCHVIQADLMDLPLRDESFDFVIADGVLHHTPNTQAAVKALYRKVAPGGQFFFYVYKKMGAARQFCDAHIRERFTKLEPESCYQACEGITELGRELAALDARITLKYGIPSLGIPAGTHNVQRLVYYNFLKCFWNDAFDWGTNNMVNFDWYHPHNAWQHTEEEVTKWIRDLGVESYNFHPANPNGLSVLLTRPS